MLDDDNEALTSVELEGKDESVLVGTTKTDELPATKSASQGLFGLGTTSSVRGASGSSTSCCGEAASTLATEPGR